MVVADFITVSMSDNGLGGVTVEFSDESLGGPINWSWDFGDSGSSVLQNPTHTYSAAGVYQVTLEVSDGSDTDTICKSVLISTQVPRYQEIWGTAVFADGDPVEPDKIVTVGTANGLLCENTRTDTSRVYRTIDDGGTTRFLVRARGHIPSIPDSGFEDGDLAYLYIGGRLITDGEGTPVTIPFFMTLPSNPSSYVELNIELPLPVTTVVPLGGTYGNRQTITMSSNITPSETYYTTDGTDPTTSPTRQLYVGPFELIEGTTTLKFYTTGPIGADEPVQTEVYTIEEPLVSATPESADYSEPQSVTLEGNRPGNIFVNIGGTGFVLHDGSPIEVEAGVTGYGQTIIQAYLQDVIHGIVGPITTFSYTIDLLRPVVTSFTINNDDPVTNGQIVTLQTVASSYTNSVIGMMVSCFSDFRDASVQLYAPETTFLLTPGDGLKTVHVKVVDQFNNWSRVPDKTDTIVLDTEIPTLTVSAAPGVPTGELTYTFTGTKSANSGVMMRVVGGMESLIIPYSEATTWTFVAHLQEGVNTLVFQAVTQVGNRSTTIARVIEVILIPSGVTEATTFAKPDGTWRVPYVLFDEQPGAPDVRIHDFELEVTADIDPNPVILFPTDDAVLHERVITVSGTAVPGSLITLGVTPKE